MALTETRPETAEPPPSGESRPAPGPAERLLGTGDHVALGRLLIGASLLLGIVTLLVRAVAGIDVLTSNGFLGERTTMLELSSLVGLAFLTVVPLVLGVMIAVVPLQLGAPSIAFPRAASFAVWTWLLSALVFLASVAANGGIGGTNDDAAKLGNLSVGAMMVALGIGAVCVATTVMSHRPEGMALARVPFFSWASLVGSTLWILTLASAVAHVAVGQISRATATGLLVNFSDGVAWLLRAPAVYVIAIPVLGVALDAAGTASGRRLRQYGVTQGLIGAFAVLAFGAWAQLPGSVNTVIWTLFALAIFVPTMGLIGAVGDVLRRGKVSVTPGLGLGLIAMLLLLGSALAGLLISLDLAGGGTLFGLNQAALVGAQSYFVLGAALLGGIAGVYQWAPQLWGERVRSAPATGAGFAVFLGAGVIATGYLVQGLVQRNGDTNLAELWGAIIAVGSVLMLLGVLGALAAIMGAAKGAVDDEDGAPVEGLTLEWAFPTPTDGGTRLEDLRPVTSPYPLLDAREGSTEELI